MDRSGRLPRPRGVQWRDLAHGGWRRRHRRRGPVGQVIVGNIFFRSAHNGSENPAVDTIAAGDSITWKWNADGSHSIQSTGVTPAIFRNSVVMAHANDSYTVTFRTAGTYPYDCGVHGSSMTRRIVVQ